MSLKFHHVPEHVINIIGNFYSDYYISVGTKNFITNPIRVEKGVLQGDCLSPILFNLCFNTLLKTIEDERIKIMGYHFDEYLKPRHWFQFADDTALVTSSQEDNQLLLNVFTKWCTWSGLIVHIDKCKTFGIRKSKTSSVQYKPYLKISNTMIPQICINERFTYLGKQFSFNMKTEFVEFDLVKELSGYLEKLDLLPLHPDNKCNIVTKFIFSKLRWKLSIYNLSETWVIQNLDNIVYYFRKWFGIPVCGNTSHLSLPISKFGLYFKKVSQILKHCNLSMRRLLKNSKNHDITGMYNLTKSKFLNEERILRSETSKKKSSKMLQSELNNKVSEHFDNLSEQNAITKVLKLYLTSKEITLWYDMTKLLPKNLFNFGRKALIFCLANNCNLYRWKRIESDKCELCHQKQTQMHVLSNCSSAANEKRYTCRHDSILYTLFTYMLQLKQHGYSVFVDLEGYSSTATLFKSLRPDMVIIKNDELTAIELTVCSELNIDKSRSYKETKYKNLCNDLLTPIEKFKLITIEITVLGFYRSHKELSKLLKSSNINIDRCYNKMAETAIRSSYFIYTNRNNNQWNNPNRLEFY